MHIHQKILIATLIALVFALPFISAANIRGTLYDYQLEERGNVLVKIDTSPEQTFVSKTGNYRFNVPLGNYTITATYYGVREDLFAQKSVAITDQEDYNVDLIMFPLNNSGRIEPSDKVNQTESGWQIPVRLDVLITAVVAFFAIVGLVVWYIFRKRSVKKDDSTPEEATVDTEMDFDENEIMEDLDVVKVDYAPQEFTVNDEENSSKELTQELQQVLDIIKDQGGRTTQKEIRKKMPQSEGKVSLIVAELEHKGLVEKIKKGRGNIIILK